MVLCVLVDFMNRNITVFTEDSSILLTKQESFFLLTDIAERRIFRGRVEEGESWVFSGEFVGVMHAVVTGCAEGSLVGGAIHRRLVFVTDVTLDLHKWSLIKEEGDGRWRNFHCRVSFFLLILWSL